MGPMAELSAAALHYGQAMCPPGDTPCVNKVGAAWEQDIEARFGALAVPPSVQKLDLIGAQGSKIGELTAIDKQVVLCFTKPDNSRVCGPVGTGNEAWETAQAMLALQGISVRL